MNLYELPELYDHLYAGMASSAFYVEMARRGRTVLELACGTGRLTIPLADAGVVVTGLDISRPMLVVGEAKAAGRRIEWIAGDMTSFALDRTFDTIVLAHNSLLHLHDAADIVACFRCVAAHLSPAGRFVFDVFNPNLAMLARSPAVRSEFGTYVDPHRGEVIAESTTDYDSAAQVNRATLYFSTSSERDFLVLPLHLRSIFPQELPLLVERAGLVPESRFGDFTGAEFGSASPHQVCVCRRA